MATKRAKPAVSRPARKQGEKQGGKSGKAPVCLVGGRVYDAQNERAIREKLQGWKEKGGQ